MASLKEVAKLCGVTPATVSYIMNGRHLDRMLPETIQKVRAAAEKLNYRPHASARSLVTGRSETLGVYAVNYLSPDGHWAEFFAVNLFAPEESDIAPQSNIRIGQATVEHAGADAVGQVEYWPWLAGLAFVVLLVEWWAYHRRN